MKYTLTMWANRLTADITDKDSQLSVMSVVNSVSKNLTVCLFKKTLFNIKLISHLTKDTVVLNVLYFAY